MAGIFFIDDQNKILEMRSSKYSSEDDLQSLLANFPRLIACSSDHEGESNWLLISREFKVPDNDSGTTRWLLDHLFVDEDGIPVLVEVKRSTDSRIRREVVGQMLDYAANAVIYLQIENIISNFQEECGRCGENPDDKLSSFLDGKMESEEFWKKIKTNLQAGRIRMLFVADEIPKELKRIIEFLNEQMDPAEVLGVEVKKYSSNNLQTIAPVIIGKTTNAESRKLASVIQSLEAREGLIDTVNEFNKLAEGKYQAIGKARDFRQVKLDQFPSSLHYEFLHRMDTGVIAEFHIESGRHKEVAKTLQSLATEIGTINGAKIVFDPSWNKKGRLRVMPDSRSTPIEAAANMLALIEKTKDCIAEAIARCG